MKRSASVFSWRFWIPVTVAGLVCWMAPAALAQAKDDLKITLTAQRVLVTEGKETLAPAEQAKPGDIIQYTASYLNQSRGMLRNLEPTLPIPAGMEYVVDSARPKPAKASLDGKRFSALPLKRRGANEAEVPATEYRALRWSAGNLPAGQSTNVTARVRVVATIATPAGAPAR